MRYMDEEQRDTGLQDNEAAFLAHFDTLYSRYATDVIRVSYFYLGDRGKAEDVCHDTFVSYFVKRPQLASGSEKAWLFKVALNRCRDIWRSSWVRRVISGAPVFETIPGPDMIGRHLQETEIMEAINALPPDFREVFILHYYLGYGINEISQMIGVPEGTVSSRLSRGRNKLKSVLGEGGE